MIDDDIQNGTSYQLNCSAYADPAPSYSWTLNDDKNIPNAVNHSRILLLYPVTLRNTGTYKCIVSNKEGNALTSANITVFGELKM